MATVNAFAWTVTDLPGRSTSVRISCTPPLSFGDTTAPVVSVSPAAATALANKLSPITIDITDNENAVKKVNVSAVYPGREAEEVIYRAGAFTTIYANSSTKSNIVNGIRLVVMRNGGFPGAPTFNVDVNDARGNEAT